MAIIDRITCAFFGLLFGALIGVACWWLYGLAFSLSYDGPGLDPVLRHWVVWVGGAFGVLGFWFRERMGDFIGSTISAIFHFEADQPKFMPPCVPTGSGPQRFVRLSAPPCPPLRQHNWSLPQRLAVGAWAATPTIPYADTPAGRRRSR